MLQTLHWLIVAAVFHHLLIFLTTDKEVEASRPGRITQTGGGFRLGVAFQFFNISQILSHHRNMTQTSAPRAPSCPADRSSASPSLGPSSETPRSSFWTRPPLPWTRRARRWASLIKEKKKTKKRKSSHHSPSLLASSGGCLRFSSREEPVFNYHYPLTSLSFIISIIIGGGSQFRAALATSRWVSRAGLHPHEHLDDSDRAVSAELR